MTNKEQQKLIVYGMRYLMRYPCSVSNFTRKLKAKFPDVTADIITATVERMKEIRLLNDPLYAKAVAETLLRVKSASRAMVRMKLKIKGLSSLLIEEVLADLGDTYDESAVCEKAAIKKLKTLQRYEPVVRKRKLSDFLLRKGFSRGMVWKVVNPLASPLSGGERNPPTPPLSRGKEK